MLSCKWKVCLSYTGDSKSNTLKITCNSFFFHANKKYVCEGYIWFPNARKHFRPSGFIVFERLENVWKPEARVFEVTSLTKKISFDCE